MLSDARKNTMGLLFLVYFSVSSLFNPIHIHAEKENEKTSFTITDEDFQQLVEKRQNGLAGFHKNIDPTPFQPAVEEAVFNWSNLSSIERERLVSKQEEMFRLGKISMLVMAGGEATRFGGPKTFVLVSDELGEFLAIKAANLHWIQKTFETNVPMYILSSEKRLEEFKIALKARNYYGLNPENFQWFVQGTVDTFIPSEQELLSNFKGNELETFLTFASTMRQMNPDGIYRFNEERRKVPAGHFDAIAAFVISGLFSEALEKGIEFTPVVNIDNLQALLKNDGMIAYFAEQGGDFGFILAEKNLFLTITELETKKILQNKLIIRFRDNTLSFDGFKEFSGEAEKDGYRYVIDSPNKTVHVFALETGRKIDTHLTMKSETGGTLVQPIDDKGNPLGKPIMKEGFELDSSFDHSRAPFFNTNTVILNLKNLLNFLDISQEQLCAMNFEERSALVREKLVKPIKANFEFKNHEVDGEYSHLGVVKEGKTKIPVVQLTRIMLQAAHLPDAQTSYIFAPRSSVFAPVKEPEDKEPAASNNFESLLPYLRTKK